MDIRYRDYTGEKVRRILGVNFNHNTLNAYITDLGFRTVRPVKTEDVVLPDRKDERDKFITDALIRWKKEYSVKRIVISLPLKNFSYRLIEMPSLKRADLRRALSFELEKYLPLTVDEYVFDFTPLERMPRKSFLRGFLTPAGQKGTAKVHVFSIRKEIINQLYKYVKEAELDIISIRCSTIGALCHFLDISGENVNGLFANFTDDSCEIVGLKNSVPEFFKNISVNINLSDEIERHLAMYPGLVYFTGNPDLSLTKKFNSRQLHFPFSYAMTYHEVKKSCLNLNFLSQGYIKKGMDYYPHILGGLSAAVVAIFLLTGVVAYYKDLRTLKSIESKISSIKNKASGILENQKKLDLLHDDSKVLLDFQNRSNITIKVIGELSEVIPNDAWLINISVDDRGKIEIEGFAKKTSDLVMAIENSKVFKNISFTSPIITKYGEERFALKMEVEGL